MQPDTVTVRPVTLSDATDVQKNCFSANTLQQVQSRIEANLRTYEQGEGVQLVAEVDGMVVGTVELARRTLPLQSHCAEFTSLVVRGDYRRRGIARRLVEEGHRYAASMGVEILEIGCRGGEPAEKVYPRLGFIEYGRLPRGLKEPWGERKVYDAVYFYQPVREVLDS